MADLPEVPNEGDLITLAQCSIMNVMAQLDIDNPELAEEIATVMRNEIRRVENEFFISLLDMRKTFAEDVKSLKEKGLLPDGHILNVLEEQANA